MARSKIQKIVSLLEQATKHMTRPMVELLVNEFGRKPFLVLTACLLSLRARDTTTYPICQELFLRAQTPQDMLSIPVPELEKIIFRINFYKRKAAQLHTVSAYLLAHHAGHVPSTKQELLAIPGIGQKTANLVLSEAFEQPAICVDTHVHRISNRLGLVKTKTAEETEVALQKIVPIKYWRLINHYFVMWGQNICTPLSPKCSVCPLAENLCPQIGVTRHR